ncbi:hypothetical protein G9P44_002296 [Scheffersomyces stipitis]|nr:hypothetical protein G9P44_002296 [Scheffersomyces stipitis]
MSNSSSYSNNNAYYRGINNENEIVSNDSSVMTNLSFSNSPFSSKAMSSSRGKLCTPRALLAVESLDSDNGIDYLPSTLKESIWSTSFRSNRVDIFSPTVSPVEICTLDRQNQYEQNQYETQRLNSSRTIGYASSKSNYDHFGEAQPKRLSYSLGSTQSFNSLNSAPITPESPTASNYKRIHTGSIGSPHLCLTFRTYKGTVFTVPPNSKFFVIKSYNILDVTSSFTHNIWTSTDLGNKRLNKAYEELSFTGNKDNCGKVFLFFSVNSSGKFCGVCEMKAGIDFNKTSDIWMEQTRWKGEFPVEWLLIKDVPNRFFQHLKIPSNEYKPVTNSRDTQEIPYDIGVSMLKIISSFKYNG